MAGSWQSLAVPPNVASGNFFADLMLLLTDGTVLVHNVSSGIEWLRFRPDPVNGYAGGSWTTTNGSSTESSMANSRSFFASGILMDGRVFVVGGEYSNDPNNPVGGTPLGEIYDPVTNTWSQIAKPGQFSQIHGDAPSCVLADGRVLFGGLATPFKYSSALWDPSSSSWADAGTAFGTHPGDTKAAYSDEETWTLLPDGSVLTVNTRISGNNGWIQAPVSAERYIPSLDIWIPTSPLPDVLTLTTVFDTVSNEPVDVYEIGPAILLPDKTLIAFGATGHTARFTLGPDPNAPGTGTWVAGPDFPADPETTVYPAGILTLSDAPAVMQPNGRVLVAAGTLFRDTTGNTDFFSKNSQFFEYDPFASVAGSLTLMDPQPPNPAPSKQTQNIRFLLLPTGQILLSTYEAQIFIYTPEPEVFQSSWQPVITDFPTTLIIGHSYLLTGTGINGLSQANSFGDDAQMATNYPIVQITDANSGAVYYLRTRDFSSMGVAVEGSQTASVNVVAGTPPGNYNLVVIASGIPSAPLAVEIRAYDLSFLLQENEFGGGQVAAQINLAGAPAVFQSVLFIVVEGFSLSGLENLAAPTVTSPLSQMTFSYQGAPLPEDSNETGPQRILFPFQVSFTDDSLFQNPTLFPAGAQKADITIGATLVLPLSPALTASAVITLVQTPNPFVLHNDPASTDPAVNQAWYLSMDLRVFQLTAGDTRFGVTAGNSGNAVADATTYITKVIGNLNANPVGADIAFQAIPENPDNSPLSLSPVDGNNNPVYNFALARVRTQDVAPANDVRVFFRLFAAQQTNSIYDPNTTYASRTNPQGEKIPVLGLQNDQIITVPFFATPRVDTSSTITMAAQTDAPNVQPVIPPDAFGAEVHTFFGCWLDINQPGMPQFPALVRGDAAGPFTGDGALLPIQSYARSADHCLVAEISYDPDPIPTGSDPSNTDKLAQRNLTFVNVPNPGHELSRRVPQNFEVRPSPAVLQSDGRPDELMIQWGNLPKGSTATVYLPAVKSSEILNWATQLYTTHRLKAADAHTVRMAASGVSYVPIPQGGPVNFAGLLTFDLPAIVTKGQRFDVVVRQITSVGGVRGKRLPWRKVMGQFNLAIPVSTKQDLLSGEESHFSIMQWIGTTIPPASRWYLGFKRYLEQLAGRVTFMGGDPAAIKPSPTGVWKAPTKDEGGHRFNGKVDGLIYDHFGDFEGFVLETRDGRKHRFHSREVAIEERVRRACDERLVTTVISTEERIVLSMILGAFE